MKEREGRGNPGHWGRIEGDQDGGCTLEFLSSSWTSRPDPTLRLLIVSLVNTLFLLSWTCHLPEAQFYHSPFHPVAPSPPFAIQNAVFPSRFVYTGLRGEKCVAGEMEVRPDSTSCFRAASVDTAVRRGNGKWLAVLATFTHSPSGKQRLQFVDWCCRNMILCVESLRFFFVFFYLWRLRRFRLKTPSDKSQVFWPR